MLVDQLQERAESVVVKNLAEGEFIYPGKPVIKWDEIVHTLTDNAFVDLLNLLKIPIKYLGRCLECDSYMAVSQINFWLGGAELSFLCIDKIIQQVFSGKRPYLPAIGVNDFIIEKLGDCKILDPNVDNEIFSATYIADQIGVKVLYSDCFTITPRFDGVYLSGAPYLYSIKNRKFRVADKTTEEIYVQVDEFINLAIDGAVDILKPAVDKFKGGLSKLLPTSLIDSVVHELRLGKKARVDLLSIYDVEDMIVQFIEKLLNGLDQHQFDTLDFEESLAVQIAVSNKVIDGI